MHGSNASKIYRNKQHNDCDYSFPGRREKAFQQDAQWNSSHHKEHPDIQLGNMHQGRQKSKKYHEYTYKS